MRDEARTVAERTLRAMRETIQTEGGLAYSVDPVLGGLRRNRVNAEILKTALRFGPSVAGALGYPRPIIDGLVRTLIRSQRPDGGWHEIHPRYDEPSPMVTAFVGEALVAYGENSPEPKLAEEAAKAAEGASLYVLRNEVRPGFFLKSTEYRADHLNADAACGAFLAAYASVTDAPKARAAAERVISHLVNEQFEDGAWPYTTAADGAPYPYSLRVRCIHYQGVTGYYLAKTLSRLPDSEGSRSLGGAAAWLATVQREDGRFDWSKSHLMFGYRLSAAYAFAAALFAACGEPYRIHAEKAVKIVDQETPGLAYRWEHGSRGGARDGIAAWRAGAEASISKRHWPLRVGHGLFREVARRRYSAQLDSTVFRAIRATLRLRASTVEPDKNYPDLFMTSEIADCTSHVSNSNSDATSGGQSP